MNLPSLEDPDKSITTKTLPSGSRSICWQRRNSHVKNSLNWVFNSNSKQLDLFSRFKNLYFVQFFEKCNKSSYLDLDKSRTLDKH